MEKPALFVTLTLAESDGVLVKRPLQLFFKRLRHELAVEYYAVGEYGGRTHRPHYHAIIFAYDVLSLRAAVTSAWGLGFVHFGHVTPASVAYVTNYIGDERSDEFAVMSKRLGRSYVEQSYAWHRNSQPYYCLVDGVKRRLPRYYKDLLYTTKEKEAHNLRLQLMNDELEIRDEQLRGHVNYYARQRLPGEIVKIKI